ncbi:fucolectin-4-like [Saccostrea cucullata]|uniref:fucolectin-4-like n=1 Tax=Saccostrea cuccullata TaxID=36930 RepID=UPI002ED3B266
MTANASSEYGDLWKAANAVDGKTECGTTDVAITNFQINPWLKVNLYNTSTVDRVLIYNRQDCCGGRLHDVSVSVIDNGRNVSCGFYPGPAASENRILFLCEKETNGNGVTISILSRNGQNDSLSVCKVEIYG